MQARPLLLTLTLVAMALAGCAENGADGGDATPPAAISNEAAAALFADAAGNVPDRYGVKMTATKDGRELLSGEAAFDEASQMSYFRMTFDESVMDDAGGGFDGGMMAGTISIYATPQGSVILMNDTVMLAPPDESSPFAGAVAERDGLRALAAPEDMLETLRDQNVTVKSVTPTVLRGKGALQVEATYMEDGRQQDVTIWLFQNPSRVARVEMTTPAGEDDPFSGATMTMDMLYESEVDLQVPAGLTRAMGLRYESNREAFSFGMGGYGEDEGPEVWTFQGSAGLALSEIRVDVGVEPMEDDAAAQPAWSMLLSEGSKSQDGITLTFDDADGDAKVSPGDTLTIERGEDADYASVSLFDTVSGYRVVPAPALLAGLAALGALALALRRR